MKELTDAERLEVAVSLLKNWNLIVNATGSIISRRSVKTANVKIAWLMMQSVESMIAHTWRINEIHNLNK